LGKDRHRAGIQARDIDAAVTDHIDAMGVLVLSALMGGVLLLWADLLARGLLAPQDLPVGVFTAVLGGVYLLWRMQTLNGARA
jgi:ABC-type Fe3+-siderophore transport system permease subunit